MMLWKNLIVVALISMLIGCGGGGSSPNLATPPMVLPPVTKTPQTPVPDKTAPEEVPPVEEPTTEEGETPPVVEDPPVEGSVMNPSPRRIDSTSFLNAGPWMDARFSLDTEVNRNEVGWVTMSFNASNYYKGDNSPFRYQTMRRNCAGTHGQGIPYEQCPEVITEHFYAYNGKVAGYHSSRGLISGSLKLTFERSTQVIFTANFSGILDLPPSIKGGLRKQNGNWVFGSKGVEGSNIIHMTGYLFGDGTKAAGEINVAEQASDAQIFTGLWEASR